MPSLAALARERLLELEPSARERPDAVRVVRAPGRVNLMGDHTDYNEGFVLPAAIDLETVIAFVPSHDGFVELTLAASGETQRFALGAIGERRGSWLDYVAGTAWALRSVGVAVQGLRGVIAATLPIGAGLSSSAALELASAWALCGGEQPPLPPVDLARAAQRGENEYVGMRCGVMDQLAVALGRPGDALLIDCRSLELRPVPLPLDRWALVVCHTGAPRRLAASEYNARRAECEAAALAARELDPSVGSLRDVDLPLLERLRATLDPVILRRARHVVAENERVVACVRALERGDAATVGRLFGESHASLRDLYEVSSPELDALVEIATATPGVVAARMTGAGFGGCTVNLVERGAVPALQVAVGDGYRTRTGREARVFPVEPAAGAGLVTG